MYRVFLLTILILLILLAFININKVFAAEVVDSGETDNIAWELNSDGVLTISGTGAINWSSITGAPWSEDLALIKKVIINDGIEEIGNYAFYSCSELESIVIPDSVTKLAGRYTFYQCSSLSEITFPDEVTGYIGELAFYGCTSLKTIKIPDGIYTIYRSAFADCSNLITVILPDTMKRFEPMAFYNCISMANINMPGSVNYIARQTFYNCSRLTNIELPEGVTYIGAETFYGCKNLISINIPDSVTTLESSVFKECSSLTSIEIPNSITTLSNSLFSNCSSLKTVILPDSITKINNSAFYGCSCLTNIEIPSSVDYLGDSAFNGCSSLTNIKIPENVVSLNSAVFNGCRSLTNITIPNSITSIGDYAFSGCSSLSNIIIPNSVTVIGTSAFSFCKSLTNIVIPESVTSVGSKSFSDCDSLKTITIPFIGNTGGSDEYFSLIFGDPYNSVHYNIFNAPALEEVIITGEITEIQNNAFRDCSQLKRITIPNSVKSIGDYAFSKCTGLTDIMIPDSVTYIGNNAFEKVDQSAIKYNEGTYAETYFKNINDNGNDNGNEQVDPQPSNFIEINNDNFYSIENNLSGNYKLMSDIDLSGINDWTPFGQLSTKFTGILDGNGYSIKGLKTSGEGLFWYNNGTIRNLTLTGGTVGGLSPTALVSIGGFCGWNEGTIENCNNENTIFVKGGKALAISGIAGDNRGKIINCTNKGEIVVQGSLNYIMYVGGLAGVNSGKIEGINYGKVDVTSNNENAYAGGITGHNNENGQTSNSSNYGAINAIVANPSDGDMAEASGITAWASKDSIIDSSINYGEINAGGNSLSFAGGICALLEDGTIEKCRNEGKVFSTVTALNYKSFSGGVVAFVSNEDNKSITDSSNCGEIMASGYDLVVAGGISGNSDKANIKKCSNIGDVTAKCLANISKSVWSGGIAGCIFEGGSITESYNKGSIIGFGNSNNYISTGGICGTTQENSTISQCYCNGAIYSEQVLGGIVGSNLGNIKDCYFVGILKTKEGTTQTQVGGIVGYHGGHASLSNVYSIVAFSDDYTVAGSLIGNNIADTSGSLISCKNYNCPDMKTIMIGLSAGSIANYSDMEYAGTFSNFDYTKVWEMGTDNYKLPILMNCADSISQNDIELPATLKVKATDETSDGPEQPSEQMGTDGTPIGAGASAQTAEKAITKAKTDKDMKGSVYNKLKLKQKKVTKSSITISWTKVTGAKKYVVYAAKSGKANKLQKITTTSKLTYTLKKVNKKNLVKGTYYKFMVVALNSKGKVVTTSKYAHIATLGKNAASNPAKVTTKAKKDKVTLKVKKTFKLAGAYTSSAKKYKIKKILGMRYESTNTKVATVSSTGVIKGIKKGTCYVYAFAQNGIAKRIKVTVK